MTREEVVGALAVGAKEIESVLETKFGATGRGLHTKALSLEGHLGAALVRKIQFVATIRNKAMHEGEFQNVPFAAWTRAKNEVLSALEALDRPEPGTRSASRASFRSLDRRTRRTGQILGGTFVLIVLAGVGLSILSNRSSKRVRAPLSLASARGGEKLDTLPPWSLDHPAHATQVFPWREEQAAFVGAGERGPLPAETVWRVTSKPRDLRRKGVTVLEMDIQLGGGQTRGKVFFPTRDVFGHVGAETHRFEVELAAKTPVPKTLRGLALGPGGRRLDGKAFECRREVPNGCGDWQDNGVRYVALSAVSFTNALKTADIR